MSLSVTLKLTRFIVSSLVTACSIGTFEAQAHCPIAGGGIGIAGPIASFSAAILPQGKGVLGVRAEYARMEQLSSDELERAVMNSQTAHSLESQQVYSLGGAYGISDDLTVGLSLPYLRRDGIQAVHYHPEMAMSMQHDIGQSDGLGDVTIYAQYRLFRNLYQGTDLALIGALKTPTGETGNKREGVRIETEHQPGSGSWDPTVGLALTQRIERLSLHASGLYTVAGSGAQSTDLGDRAQAGVAAVYRLGGKLNYGECDEMYEYFYPESRSRWLGDLVLELNGQWQDKARVGGVTDRSTGGTVVYLSPGLRASFDARYSAYLSLGIPIYQQLNGNQSEVDYRLLAGVALAFR